VSKNKKNIYNNLIISLRSVLGRKNEPLHEPLLIGNEKKYLNQCINSTFLAVGKFNDKFEKEISKYTKSKYCVSVVNGTSAIHISLKLLGCDNKHEILVPTLTFVGTVNAIKYTGAHPHFIDSQENFVNLDILKLDKYLSKISIKKGTKTINKKTGKIIKAIIPVHTYGHPVEMEGLMKLANKYNLEIVEDAAEGIGSFYKKKHVGTFGKIGILSFNGNKTITAGGGGAILTNDKKIAVKARHLSTTAKIKKGYEFIHDEVGYNYRLSNISSAVGYAQIKNIRKIIKLKRELFKRYKISLEKINFVKIMKEPVDCKSNYWLQTILVNQNMINKKDYIINFLNKNGYGARPAWKLISELKPYKHNQKMNLSNAKNLQKRIINIPSSPKILI
jgi:perosamine synthetase